MVISTTGLEVGYRPAPAPPALRDVTFSVRAGECIGVLGPNGGGKTTLFRALLGELPARAGEVVIEARLATVPQTDRSRLDFPVTALDVALMGTLPRLAWWRRPGRAERREALTALREVGLESLGGARFGTLSGGQRQRVLIARALMQDAGVLLLDEPFSGLDTPSSEQLSALLDRLTAQGRSLLIATHDLQQTRGWDRVLCLNGRQVAFGIPDEVLDLEVLRETYGAAIVRLPGEEGAAIMPAHHHHHDA